MRVLVLSWDVSRPGAVDPDVLALAASLVEAGIDVEVVLEGSAGATSTNELDGVVLTWVAEAPPVIPIDQVSARTMAFATRAQAAATRRLLEEPADVLLASGWQTTWTAAHLRATTDLPIVALLPSIQVTRGGDLGDPEDLLVHQVEWWLTYEARRVVTTSGPARRQLRSAFRLPAGKIDVIPAVPSSASVVARLARTAWRRTQGPASGSTTADAWVRTLQRAMAEEAELRAKPADVVPLRPLLVRELGLEE